MTPPDTSAPAVEAMIARLREPTNVCGACGQPWTGDKCGQADNDHPYQTCYPHNEINLEEAAAMLATLLSARAEQAKDDSLAWSHFSEWVNETIEQFKAIYDAKAIGGMQFFAGVISDKAYAAKARADELAALRAELAKVTAERDEAIAAKKAKHKEMFEATNYYEDLVREIEAERDAAREALKLAREALEPFATEAHRLDVGINRSDLDHKWTQTAKAQVSYGMLRRVLEALAAIDGIDGIDAVKKGEQS